MPQSDSSSVSGRSKLLPWVTALVAEFRTFLPALNHFETHLKTVIPKLNSTDPEKAARCANSLSQWFLIVGFIIAESMNDFELFILSDVPHPSRGSLNNTSLSLITVSGLIQQVPAFVKNLKDEDMIFEMEPRFSGLITVLKETTGHISMPVPGCEP